MRNLRFSLMCGGLSLLAGTFLGCNEAVQGSCPKPIGTFQAEYSMLSGTCQPGYEAFPLTFAADNATNTTQTTTRLADVIVTETTLRGCELSVTQRVTGEGSATSRATVRSAIAGELGVVNKDALSGTVIRTDFMEDGVTVRCSAQYEAWYTKDSLLLGAAARE